MHRRLQKNFDRADAQVDALQRGRCVNKDYKPPEDDVGHTFLNSPIIGNDALQQIAGQVAGQVTKQSTTSPASGLGWLWPVATAMLGGGVAFAAARLLNTDTDTDTANTYRLEQLAPRPLSQEEYR
jgi:hypothetical protein